MGALTFRAGSPRACNDASTRASDRRQGGDFPCRPTGCSASMPWRYSPALAESPDFALARRNCPATGFHLVTTEPRVDPDVGRTEKNWFARFTRQGCSLGRVREKTLFGITISPSHPLPRK